MVGVWPDTVYCGLQSTETTDSHRVKEPVNVAPGIC